MISSTVPDGSALYVPRRDSGTVAVIETATNTIFGTIDVGGAPGMVLCGPTAPADTSPWAPTG